eukprot:1968481-Lingulodinium_polyedra.AAC.1
MASTTSSLFLDGPFHVTLWVSRGHLRWLAPPALREVDNDRGPRLGNEDQQVWVSPNNACHHVRP